MKLKYFLCIVFIVVSFISKAQEIDFRLTENTKSETIPFQIVKNLLIIPVKVNGNEMNFIIDSGLKETILFGRYQNSINHSNLKEVKLKGLGSNLEGSKGYISTGNEILISSKYINTSAKIVIIQDENFDLFSRFGMDVHGIIGYEFFKNYPIKIDYLNKRFTIYQSNAFIKNKNRYQISDIYINRERKPYFNIDFTQNETFYNQKMLLDLGNSDGLWLLKTEIHNLTPPQNAFYDELGKGFNGIVSGERGAIKELSFGKHIFKNPLIAIPNISSIQFVQLEKDRKGSIGNEILRRFTIILDYNDQKIYYKPNRNFNQPFHYNRSGLTIVHSNFEWGKETVNVSFNKTNEMNNQLVRESQIQYKLVMNPVYKIESIRKNSNAEKVGLLINDQLVSLNNRKTNKMNLNDIENFMLENEFKEITMVVLRNNQLLKYKFILEIPYENN